MSHLVKLIQSFSKDESGAALVEYAVIFAVLVAGTVAALGLIAPEIVGIFDLVVAQIGPIAP
jgi:Flp pilus assembly pilin Flp